MIKKIILFGLIFMLSITTVIAQDNQTDKEALRKELKAHTKLSDKEIETQIEELEKYTEEINNKGGFEAWFHSQPLNIPESKEDVANRAFTDCSDFTFTNGTLTGWCLCYSQSPFEYTDPFCEVQNCNVNVPDFLPESNDFRFSIADNNDTDVWLNSIGEEVADVGDNVLKLGNGVDGERKEQISKSFTLNNLDEFIYYEYAIILEDPNHSQRPFFSSQILINGEPVPCSRIFFEAFSSIPGFEDSPTNANIKVRPWRSNIIRPSDYGAQVGDEITFIGQVSDCGLGAHFGYAYFDITCLEDDDIIILNDGGVACLNDEVTFSTSQEILGDFTWTILDTNNNVLDTFNNIQNPTYTFTQVGVYTIQIDIDNFTTTEGCPEISSMFTKTIRIDPCVDPCDDCYSFQPKPGEEYIISGWVKEEHLTQVMSYNNTYIRLTFFNEQGTNIQSTDYKPFGFIIDGWQRVAEAFTIPSSAVDIEVELRNDNKKIPSYFDDIRVHPYNGNMKSYVYDPQTQWLMAELDENNYTTYYEYDSEGGLVRVKKETEKGVYTLQETRTSTTKTTN